MEGDCMPSGCSNWLNDNIVMVVVILAVILGILYLIIKAGVKNGILEVLEQPDCPLIHPCGNF